VQTRSYILFRTLQHPPEGIEYPLMRYTLFTIGDESFGIEIQRVVEILNPLRLHKIPELPSFISGVINVRGDIIPVIDLRVRFGIEYPSGKYRVLIVRLENYKIGMYVDKVTEIIDIPDERISRPPKFFKGFREEFMKGIGHVRDERIIIILDVEKVLTTEEKIELNSSRKDLSP
jgi:purine-binding chemotaxis protein CheW